MTSTQGLLRAFFPVGVLMKMPKGGKLLQKIKNAALIENKNLSPQWLSVVPALLY